MRPTSSLRSAVVLVALTLESFLLAGDLSPAQNDAKPLAVPDGFVLQPEFQIKKKSFAAGTAFVVKLEGFPRPVILSAIHLVGPAGGYTEDVPAAKLAQVVEKVTFTDQFTGKNAMWVTQGVLTIPDAAPLGKTGKAGDIMALWAPDKAALKPAPLAAKTPAKGETVWVATRAGGAPATQRLHRATVILEEEGKLYYFYDNPKFEIQGTSGAPVLNAAGEVVGINLGGGTSQGKVGGVANPVGVFREHLVEACKKYPPDKVKSGK
ncbi:hypothetical protein AYO44_09495 [Planctomycetaceae bacterium SCGC AG-212-F19]|nr:hypothetical protein AYO44_09495 [Planctomycetaceae bacterium SCGC AG-212-F19]